MRSLRIRNILSSGWEFARNQRLLKLQAGFYLASLSMLCILAIITASRFFSFILSPSILSKPFSEVINSIMGLGASVMLGFALLIAVLWAASQWISAFLISYAQFSFHHSHAPRHARGSSFSRAWNTSHRTASTRFFSFLACVLLVSVINFFGQQLFDYLFVSLGDFGLILSTLASTILSLALLFSPYKLIAGKGVRESVQESVRLLRMHAWDVVRAGLYSRLAGYAILLAGILPAGLIAFSIAQAIGRGEMGSLSFWMLVALLIPALLFAVFALAFRNLFEIGALSYAHQVLTGKNRSV